MKKRVFTLLTMIALVALVGSAWGQTNVSPIIGTTYTYTWADVTTGAGGSTSYAVTLSTSDDPTTAVQAEGTVYEEEVANTWAASGDDVVIQLSWTPAALANADYKLWLIATTAAPNSCSNYRSVTIAPAIDFELEVLGLRAEAIDPTTLDATAGNADNTAQCQDIEFRDDADLEVEGGTNDGNVYLVFRASQVFDFNKAWDATLVASTGTVQYWDGSDWQTGGAVTDIPTNTVQYFRVRIPAVIVANPAVDLLGTLTAVDEDAKADANSTNDAISGIINPIPSIGAFN